MHLRNSFHIFAILGLGAFTGIVKAQDPTLPTKPDAIVVVKEDPTTAELVEITMLDPNFPRAELEAIVVRLGKNLSCTPRGFTSYVEKIGPNARDQFVKSRIGLNNLIDRGSGTVNLGAVAQAFAGVKPPHAIKALKIVLDGEVPNENTVAQYADASVIVDGQVLKDPAGIEYLVALRTQDPTQITIPLKNIPKSVPVKAKPTGTNGPNVIVVLIVLASVSAGALVYFLLVGRGNSRSTGAK